jgi:cyanophycinase-like exopeptidase
LGLIDGVVIDTHFVRRGRIGRLFQTVVSNPRVLGIGWERIQDHTTNIKWKVPVLVILVDGRDIKDTNLTQVKLGQPISINNLVVHVMSMNDTYNIETHKMQIKLRNTFNIRYRKSIMKIIIHGGFFSESSSQETKIAKQTALKRIVKDSFQFLKTHSAVEQ